MIRKSYNQIRKYIEDLSNNEVGTFANVYVCVRIDLHINNNNINISIFKQSSIYNI